MNAIVIEHVRVSELPIEWQHKLGTREGEVTIRIEPPAQRSLPEDPDDPLFGMWADREDMADVAAYVRRIRASRFNDDGSRKA